MSLPDFGKVLIALGGLLVVVGVLLVLGPRVPFLGRLPGDILVQRDGVTFYFPLVTMIVISLVLTVLLNVIPRLFR